MTEDIEERLRRLLEETASLPARNGIRSHTPSSRPPRESRMRSTLSITLAATSVIGLLASAAAVRRWVDGSGRPAAQASALTPASATSTPSSPPSDEEALSQVVRSLYSGLDPGSTTPPCFRNSQGGTDYSSCPITPRLADRLKRVDLAFGKAGSSLMPGHSPGETAVSFGEVGVMLSNPPAGGRVDILMSGEARPEGEAYLTRVDDHYLVDDIQFYGHFAAGVFIPEQGTTTGVLGGPPVSRATTIYSTCFDSSASC
jgi:hypothetical protein